MRITNKFFGFALTAIAAGALVSCSNELNEPNVNGSDSLAALKLVKTPDVVAWSGEQVLGSTFGTRSVNLPAMYATRATYGTREYYKTWDGDYPEEYKDKIPADIQQDEKTYILNYIKNHSDEGGYECNLSNYFIQNIGGSFDKYKVTYINGEDNNKVFENGVWTGEYKDENNTRTAEFTGSGQMDYFSLNGEHVPDYNANYGPTALCLNWPVNNPTYHDSWGTEDKTKENHYKFFIIEYPVGSGIYNYYLGFDYATKKWDNGDINYNGDGIYNDWVIKLTPANGTVTPPTGDKCTECDHPKHNNGKCDECKPNEGCNKPSSDNPDLSDGDVKLPNGGSEVEVNLAINDTHIYDNKDINDLVVKLSIHVRYAGDVEIFIPMNESYICEADDMYIIQKHEEGYFAHGGPYTTTYTLNGFDVSLSVSYEDNGIIITTDGVENVYEYLVNEFGDGMNFEVYLYLNKNDEITPGGLKELLDTSTIKFLDEPYPNYYINAFTGTKVNNSDVDRDCKVSLIQSSEYDEGQANLWHLNGKQKNLIYRKKGVNVDYETNEHNHDWLWNPNIEE